jgi:hypothetical protein
VIILDNKKRQKKQKKGGGAMLHKKFFDDSISYFLGRSILSWNSHYVQRFDLKQGIIILKEVIDETEDSYIYGDPEFIFGGSILEIENIGGGYDYLIIDWNVKELYWGDCLFIYKEGKKFKYELVNNESNLDEVLKKFLNKE